MDSLPVNVEGLIPHGKKIRLVDRLLAIGNEKCQCDYHVNHESPLVDDSGQLDELALIEIIAQAVAASRGYLLTKEERNDHAGLLLGIRDLTVSNTAHVGDHLTVHAHIIARFGDFAVVEGEVRHADGRLIATGELKMWSGTKANLQNLENGGTP